MASTDPAVSFADSAPSHRPAAGIGFLLLATTLFPIQDVIIKMLSGDYAVHQIVFWRGVFALPIVAGFAWLSGGLWPLKLGSIPLQFARAAAGFSSYLVYYMALAAIGLAETAAITFSTPIFVTIFAMFFLGEKIGLFRWLAVALGLIGVVVIVQPGAGVFEPAAVLALLAAVTYATSIVLTRKLGNRTNGGSMTLFTVCFFIVAGGGVGADFLQRSGRIAASVPGFPVSQLVDAFGARLDVDGGDGRDLGRGVLCAEPGLPPGRGQRCDTVRIHLSALGHPVGLDLLRRPA